MFLWQCCELNFEDDLHEHVVDAFTIEEQNNASKSCDTKREHTKQWSFLDVELRKDTIVLFSSACTLRLRIEESTCYDGHEVGNT